MKKTVIGCKLLFKIMKIAIVQVVVGLVFSGISLAFEGRAQDFLNKPITINVEEARLRSVLSAIEKQADVWFVYSSKAIKADRKVTLNTKGQRLSEVLFQMLNALQISYRIVEGRIILNPADEAAVPTGEASPAGTETAMPEDDPDVSIKGSVTDEKGEGLPGVSILLKGTQQGTVTDASGSFTLNVPDDKAVLVFSFVGYLSQEVTVGNRTSLEISLQTDEKALEEVVVIGYGTQKRSDISSSISRISGEEIQARPVARVDLALQGQLAGVQVQQSSGRPGVSAQIRVRGTGSISAGSEPLYVVDGFPVDANTFSNTNLSNIESIEVLKDAAAASIYGSRGSNGVILITTKKGKSGSPKFEIRSNTGVQNIERFIPMLNTAEYMSFIVDARENGWVRSGGNPNVPISERARNYQYDPEWKSDPHSFPDYQNYKWPFRTALMQDYQVTASGGSDKVRYLVSGNYFDQQGIVKNTDFTRYSFNTNLSLEVNEFLNFGFNFTPAYSISNDRDSEGQGNMMHLAIFANPFIPIRTGVWGESLEYDEYRMATESGYRVVSRIENLMDKETRGQVLANLYGNVKLAKGLNFKSTFGAIYVSTKRDRFENQIISRTRDPLGESWNTLSLNWINENTLDYSTVLDGKHSISALLGYTSQKQNNQSGYLRGENFANDLVPTLNAAGVITQGNTNESEWALLSYLGRLNYSYDNRYLLSASLRRDGSSRFGTNRKWGWFPAVSVGWGVSKESFFEAIPFASDLKLRASLGMTGNNNIPNYGSIGLLGQSRYLFGRDESLVVGMFPSSITNNSLSWETTTTLDIGMDFGLWSNRITGSVDYYNNKTKDLLLNVPVPTVTGFGSELRNIGRVENKGLEFEIVSKNIVGSFQWSTNLNLSFNKNRVLQLGPGNAPIVAGGCCGEINITQVGQPIGAYYLLIQDGVWNTAEEIAANIHWTGSLPGDVRIRDVNGDGFSTIDDRAIVGQSQPKHFYGITNRFAFKGFDLSFLINGVGGNKIFDDKGREFDLPRDSHKNHYKVWANRWRSPEQPGDGMTPVATDFMTGASGQYTTRHLYNGSFLRLKNVHLGYDVPQSVVHKIGMQSVRISLTGENLFTFDHFEVGYNPETNLRSGNPLAPGGDYGQYPLAKTFLLGLHLTF